MNRGKLVNQFCLVITPYGVHLFFKCIFITMAGCRKLLGQAARLEDLQEAHPEIHSNLQKLLAMREGVSDLGLVFQVQGFPALAPSRSEAWL